MDWPVSYTHLDVYKRQVQRGAVGLVFRTIATRIPEFEELGLPEVLKDVAMSKRGLVIFVGATGSVSYTHLDVYKRQALLTASTFTC